MPEITIKALGPTRDELGFRQKTVSVDGDMIADVLQSVDLENGMSLYERYVDEDGNFTDNFALLANGRGINCSELDTTVETGDEIVTVTVLRPISGG